MKYPEWVIADLERSVSRRRKRRVRSESWKCPECHRVTGQRPGDRVSCGHCGYKAKRIFGE